MKRVAAETAVDVAKELAPLEKKLAELRAEIYKNLTPMQRVQVARHPKRPYTLDYLSTVFTDFVELHGDRLFRDDPAIVAGWARLDGVSVMVIGHQKGRDTKENLRRNFGMAHPEGHRKALRLMRPAAPFRPPRFPLGPPPARPRGPLRVRPRAELSRPPVPPWVPPPFWWPMTMTLTPSSRAHPATRAGSSRNSRSPGRPTNTTHKDITRRPG